MAITKLSITGNTTSVGISTTPVEIMLVKTSATGVPVTPNDNITATNVQAALEQLDDIKVQATNGTLTNPTISESASFGDNDKAKFGASDDLQIYHDGSNSYIRDDGTGELRLNSDNAVRIRKHDNETLALFSVDGSATLYHDNSPKIATTSTGIDVTGGITASGHVGIGTTSPSMVGGTRTLHINGNSGGGGIRLSQGSVNDGSISYTYPSGISFSTFDKTRLRINANLGDVSFYEDSGTTAKLYWDASAEQFIAQDGAFFKVTETDSSTVAAQLKSDSDEGLLQLYHSGAEKVRLRTNADSYFNGGNVGIGTSSPTNDLHIKSTINSPILIETTHAGGNSRIEFKNENYRKNFGVNADGRVTLFDITNAKTPFIIDNNSENNTLVISGSNVGIGTSSPARELSIGNGTGSPNIQLLAASAGNSRIEFGDAEDSDAGEIQYVHSSNYMQFTTNGSERFRIDSSGNVGIGTTNLTRKFRVVDATDASVDFRTTDGTDRSFEIDVTSSASEVTIGTATNHALAVKTNDAERMRLDSSGNVGIGTTSPTQKLDVSSAGTTRIQVKNTNLTSSGLYIAEDGTGAQINETGAYPLRFNTSGTERMRIDSSGNVLIGKTASDSGATVGIELLASDTVIITDAASSPLILNRTSTDGNIQEFKNDGLPVGAIGVSSGEFYIAHDGTTDTGLRFRGNGTIIPVNSAGNGADASQDLGHSLYRFKDLYLSGGAYLGGTGSANKLDDYEEGDWTPIVQGSTSGTASYTANQASYTKIGNVVYFQCYLNTVRLDTHNIVGNVQIGGLPFVSAKFARVQVGHTNLTTFDENTTQIVGFTSSTFVALYTGSSLSTITASNLASSSTNIMVSGVYTTNS